MTKINNKKLTCPENPLVKANYYFLIYLKKKEKEMK